MLNRTADFLILGGGIVGLTLARELKTRHQDSRIVILEKEAAFGLHSSGRNSGVLHSGIYYPPGSLKAKLCRQGAIEMADYHRQHRIALDRRGKILLPTRAEDQAQLELLLDRAKTNQVEAVFVGQNDLEKLEPEVCSPTGRALYIESTAVGSPSVVMERLVGEVESMGVELHRNSSIANVDVSAKRIVTAAGVAYAYGHVINTTGLHADRVAHLFGVGHQYRLLPFKGIYWKLNPASPIKVNHLVYPVPDLRVPFLGVHTTTTTDGSTYLGPTAVPAWGRENYHGLSGVEPLECLRIVGDISRQYMSGNDGFRRLAWQEGRRYFKPWFLQAAKAVLPRLQSKDLMPTSKVGIRAQMIDLKTRKLVTDFLVEQGSNSTHVLNAISPAWTSSFPLARYICDEFIRKVH